MYECPNCGGNLKFNISLQQLFCAYCESAFDPYSVSKETDTVDGDCFETNVFRCPQCGGEMISSDNDATSFCSYCGSANILSERIGREKRPKHIIPFQITKDGCKKAYAAKLRKAFFVPKELKDPAFIDGFRGIYMPYWSYRISQQGQVALRGEKEKRSGDYVYTDHYALTGDLDAGYEGYSCDASAGFSDNISEALGPYDIRDVREFTPTFLSGFYAETADVDPEVYREDAEGLAADVTFDKVKDDPVFRKHGIQESGRRQKAAELCTCCKGEDSAMFPVWFMSYRNGDRIAYAAVNGQTGKVVTDLPVDGRRFFGSSMVLAVPLFFLLNLFLTLRPSALLACSAGLAAAAAFLYYRELAKILSLETGQEDRGLMAKNPGRWKPKKEKRPSARRKGTLIMVLWFTLAIVAIQIVAAGGGTFLVWLTAVIVMAAVCVAGLRKYRKLEKLNGGLGFLYAAGAVLLGCVTGMWKPVSDLWYYGAALLILLTVIFILWDIIRNYNRLAMRRLPQFDKKGGDDNA
ncbi:hypothetical protein IMSAG185_00739 [Lachnospiraceae bacterium]|jgi:DNA-directed RNA polymerase subunit RPC12/RpoP|nr:hypothetical protein [Lachnospiraceae bacterium]GFI65145.1 hypothetical protein IMSAG185_00739 [Lachnospiraceae bacterium]